MPPTDTPPQTTPAEPIPELASVRLTADYPCTGLTGELEGTGVLPAGTVGVVLDVIGGGAVYLLEVFNEAGETLAVVGVPAEKVERVEP